MAEKDMTRAEQEQILAEIARDESAPPSARVTAIRTLTEMRGEDEPRAGGPEGLALIHPSRYKRKPGARNSGPLKPGRRAEGIAIRGLAGLRGGEPPGEARQRRSGPF